jgi:CPA1 family monovalent cation:H+ antiporter
MESHAVELIAVLFAIMLALATAAQRLLVPYPIVLVLGGLVLGVVPGLPPVRLHPELVFFVFLPPILWAAAYFTSLRDVRANLRPITLLALGLVCATTAVVAVVARAVVPGMSWAAAVALGAIVSPPDAVSAVAIVRRLRIPHRLVVVLEGESLVNDAIALVLYRAAVVAMVTGVFPLESVTGAFVLGGLGGVAIGLAVSGLAVLTLRSTTDSLVEIAITLLAPYVAWTLAERAHTSAVLACVAGGLLLRRHLSSVVAPATRLEARAVWGLLLFALNGVIFILIGLQLRTLVQSQTTPVPLGTLAAQGLVVSAAAVLTRIGGVPLVAVVPRLVPSIRARDPLPPWPHLAVVAWAGMRGIVSLAAALALPLVTADGSPLSHRQEIIVFTFIVVVVTLVVQGLSLTPLIRWLDLPEDRTLEEERLRAEGEALRAALGRLAALRAEPWAAGEPVDDLRRHYEDRARLVAERQAGVPPASSLAEAAFKRARYETLAAERQTLLDLRDRSVIGDEVLLDLEQELDVEAARHGLAGYDADEAKGGRRRPGATVGEGRR